MPGARHPRYIELVGSELGVDFPACLGIYSMTPFRMRNRDYVAIAYGARETREDDDLRVDYVYANDTHARTARDTLADIKAARAAYAKAANPQARFVARDFIADRTGSFAAFDFPQRGQCDFMAEAGGNAIMASHADFAPGSRCAGILASSRLEVANTVYYIGMFNTDTGKQLVGVLSTARDGKITIEKNLARQINRSDATRNVKTAKETLANLVR